MRLILLLCLLPLFTFSQDTLVCIKPQTARYFLEANDERWILREKDTLQTLLITNLREAGLVKDQIIFTHEKDSSSYGTIIKTLEAVITLKSLELEDSRKDLRRRKRLELLIVVGTVIAIILL